MKIIAKEVNPSDVDFSWYFDDDGLRSSSGKNCACYIIPADRRRNSGFNMDEYEKIENLAENIADAFHEISEGRTSGYGSFANYKEAMLSYGIPYSSRKCHLLKEWAKTNRDNDSEDIAAFLSIVSGEEWEMKSFRGYCQGDYCEVVYCPAHYSEGHINEIGYFWLGCGTEFCIDDTYGYFVLDTVRWREGEELRNLLAGLACCEPDELEVYLWDGEYKVDKHRLMTA